MEVAMKHKKTRKLLKFFIEKDNIIQRGIPVTDTDKRLVKLELNRSENKHTYKNIIIFVLTLLNLVLWMCI